MTIDNTAKSDLSTLKELWKEAFGDTDDFINAFFGLGFSPSRTLCLKVDGVVVSVIYFFDCEYDKRKIAYVYGVATKKSHRGNGYSSLLMRDAHKNLKALGYDGIILVPASKGLFDFYSRLGYTPACYVDELEITASNRKTDISEVGAVEYFEKRIAYLPRKSVIQGEKCFDFLSSQARFFVGEDFVFATRKDSRDFFALEFLGNRDKMAPAVNTMGYKRGRVRIKGSGSAFAAYFSLTKNEERLPEYLGFAFD